jgi:hypothetical protein
MMHGTQSNIQFLKNPDATAVFELNKTDHWLHVSNAENIAANQFYMGKLRSRSYPV